ncbi:MAG: hypothetical protein PVJ82_12830, partial [Desulfobacteraceae bacterium]
ANSSLEPGPPGLSLGIAAMNSGPEGLVPADSAVNCGAGKGAACKTRKASRKWHTDRRTRRLFLYMAGLSLTPPLSILINWG